LYQLLDVIKLQVLEVEPLLLLDSTFCDSRKEVMCISLVLDLGAASVARRQVICLCLVIAFITVACLISNQRIAHQPFCPEAAIKRIGTMAWIMIVTVTVS
jgi:hypothetical protein